MEATACLKRAHLINTATRNAVLKKTFRQQRLGMVSHKAILIFAVIFVFTSHFYPEEGITQDKRPEINHITDKTELYKGDLSKLIVGFVPSTLDNGDKIQGTPEVVNEETSILKIKTLQSQRDDIYYLWVRNDGSLFVNQKFQKLSARSNDRVVVGRIGDGNKWTDHVFSFDGRAIFSYDGSFDDLSPTGKYILVSDFLINEKGNNGLHLSLYKIYTPDGTLLHSFKRSGAIATFVTDSIIQFIEQPFKYVYINGASVDEIPVGARAAIFSDNRATFSNDKMLIEFTDNKMTNTVKGDFSLQNREGVITASHKKHIVFRVYKDGDKFGIKSLDGKTISAPIFDGYDVNAIVDTAGSLESLREPHFSIYQREFLNFDGRIVANRIDGFEVNGKDFSEELALVRRLRTSDTKNSVGYVTRRLNYIIPPIFSDGTSFKNGIAWVLKDNKWYSIENPLGE